MGWAATAKRVAKETTLFIFFVVRYFTLAILQFECYFWTSFCGCGQAVEALPKHYMPYFDRNKEVI